MSPILVSSVKNGILNRRGGAIAPPPPSDSFTLGTTKPTTSNTGVPSGTSLTTVSTVVSLNTAGVSYTNTQFDNWVNVNAPNISFTNCLFRGPVNPWGNTRGLVNCTNAAVTSASFDRCTFNPQTPWDSSTGLIGHDYTAQRCQIVRCVDGFGVYNTAAPNAAVNVKLFGNLVDRMSFFCPCSSQSNNQTHNDALQIQGGTNINVTGNLLLGMLDNDDYGRQGVGYAGVPDPAAPGDFSSGHEFYPSLCSNAAIQFNNNVGPISGITIDQNWFGGGSYSLNIANTIRNNGFANITNNRFVASAKPPRLGRDFNIVAYSGTTFTLTGNTYEDTGAAMTVRKSG